MNIVNVARQIVDYYCPKAPIQPRGSTKAAIRGAVETNASVLFATHQETQYNYNGLSPNKAISLDQVAGGILNGTAFGWGMVVDNGAVVVLLKGLLAEIDKKSKKSGTDPEKFTGLQGRNKKASK